MKMGKESCSKMEVLYSYIPVTMDQCGRNVRFFHAWLMRTLVREQLCTCAQNERKCCQCVIHSSPHHTLYRQSDVVVMLKRFLPHRDPNAFRAGESISRLNDAETHWTTKLFTVKDSLRIVPGVCTTSSSVSWNHCRLPYRVSRWPLYSLLGFCTHDADVAWDATHAEALKVRRKPFWRKPAVLCPSCQTPS